MGIVLNEWLSLLDGVLGGHVLTLYFGPGSSDVWSFDYGTFTCALGFVAIAVWLVTLSVHVLTDLFEVK